MNFTTGLNLKRIKPMSHPFFKPFSCRGLEMPNRIVMAPMTRSFSPDGVPGDNVAGYYARRAAADVGLILTEGYACGPWRRGE